MHTENSRGGRRKRGGWGSRLGPGPSYPQVIHNLLLLAIDIVIHNLMQVAILTALNP